MSRHLLQQFPDDRWLAIPFCIHLGPQEIIVDRGMSVRYYVKAR